MKKNAWLLIANASIARLFKIDKPRAVIPLCTLKHDESRLHNLDLVSDKPGRSFESRGSTRHGLGDEETPKKHEEQVFAKQVARFLEQSHAKNDLEHLYIAAGPTFLGMLRSELHKSTKEIIAGELDKELAHLTLEEIPEHLLPFFP